MKNNIKIYKNYFFIELLKKIALNEKNDIEKINFIMEIARFMSCNVTGIYSDIQLESQLILIGKKIKFNKPIKPVPNTVLHVMTAAGITGGHTRVVNNWIEFDNKRKHSIIFTEQKYIFTEQKCVIPKFLKDTVEKSGGKIYFLTGNDKLKQSENLLNISSTFEKIILSVHMYDTIPIIAYSNVNWTTPIYFYNHAEFRFWLGVSISDLVLDISKEDKKKSLKDRGIINSRLLSIPIKSEYNCSNQNQDMNYPNNIKLNYDLPIESKIVTSMAQDYKYTVVKGFDFPKFMITLIQKDPSIYVVIIGGKPEEEKWKRLIDTGRARILGRLEADEVEKIFSLTDVYIDSFPMPSYTSVLEAISKKIPVVSYDVKGYRLDALLPIKSVNMKQMMDITLSYLKDKDIYDYKKVNELIEFYHYKIHWLERMEKIFKIDLKHHIHRFKTKFVCGEFEELNNALESFENSENYKFFKGLSSKNTLITKLLAKLFFIDLK